MDAMRADMGGAACVFGSILAIAKLKLPLNVIALLPLTENMPGSRATRPGDVVTAMNGKTIQVDNTDAEGRLILADALCYADSLSPRLVLDIATLTGACSVALGTAATGVFCTDTKDFAALERCGSMSGDRMWRLPLWRHYTDKVKKTPLADLQKLSPPRHGRRDGQRWRCELPWQRHVWPAYQDPRSLYRPLVFLVQVILFRISFYISELCELNL